MSTFVEVYSLKVQVFYKKIGKKSEALYLFFTNPSVEKKV